MISDPAKLTTKINYHSYLLLPMVLEIKPRTLEQLSKHFTTEQQLLPSLLPPQQILLMDVTFFCGQVFVLGCCAVLG